jgi:phosphoglycerate dehydrogenase-like enzyme
MVDISNILVTGGSVKEMEKIIKDTAIFGKKQWRFKSEEDVKEEDFYWADTYAAFAPTNNFTFGNIKWVHSTGAGVDKFLDRLDWKDDVLLTKTICSFGQRIGEYSLSYILKDCQHHDTFREHQSDKAWREDVPVPLAEKTAVIYGTGNIGQETAKILSFFGIKVCGVSLSGKQKEYFEKVYSTEDDNTEVLQKADYIISTMPLTKKTRKMFDNSFFEKLSDTGFINVGRGASVDSRALLDALDKGQLKFAVLDVFETEPLLETDPLWSHPKVNITPHISAVTTPEEGTKCFLDTIRNIDEGRDLTNIVDVKRGY